MGAPPEFVAFHIGIVVHDLDAVIDRYRRMLGLDLWHVGTTSRPRLLTAAATKPGSHSS